MKKAFTIIIATILAISASAQATYSPTAENLASRKEFADSKFGIFIHWGVASVFGQGEWYLNRKQLDHSEYKKAADAYYPHRFDAKAWVAAIKDSGAKYITFVSRHHDGFSMWDSAYTDYDIVDATPYKRDIIKALARECHKQGIRLHFYYSHIDWSRSDYPIATSKSGYHKRVVTGQDKYEGGWDNYYKFMNNQLTELLTKYGKIGAIWFDGHWDHAKDEKPFDWQLDEQYALIHKLQPACLIGNNHHIAAIPGEDFQIFERDLPGENTAGYSAGQSYTYSMPLETCQTMNKSWGYSVGDTNYKSLEYLIRYLVSTSGKGANLLLNIGPQPNGELPAAALERLKGMGEWMRKYGDTIYGTTAGDIAAQPWGVTTRKGDRLFVHIFDLKEKSLNLQLNCTVESAKLFDGGKAVKFTTTAEGVTLSFDEVPSGTDYIVELKTK